MKNYYVTYICGSAIDAIVVAMPVEVKSVNDVEGLARSIHGALAQRTLAPIPLPRIIVLSWTPIEPAAKIVPAGTGILGLNGGRQQ